MSTGEDEIGDVMSPCREYPVRYPNGYGKRYIRGSKPYRSVLVHRWVWEQVHGPIPDGLRVMHRCDNPPCYRLDHLCLGTQADNLNDMRAKGRGRSPDTYIRRSSCHKGHPYDEGNTYVDSQGERHCRACGRLNARRRRSMKHD